MNRPILFWGVYLGESIRWFTWPIINSHHSWSWNRMFGRDSCSDHLTQRFSFPQAEISSFRFFLFCFSKAKIFLDPFRTHFFQLPDLDVWLIRWDNLVSEIMELLLQLDHIWKSEKVCGPAFSLRRYFSSFLFIRCLDGSCLSCLVVIVDSLKLFVQAKTKMKRNCADFYS